MAKIQIKSEKLTPFGGIFHVMELFERHLSHIIDGALEKRGLSLLDTIIARLYVLSCACISVEAHASRMFPTILWDI